MRKISIICILAVFSFIQITFAEDNEPVIQGYCRQVDYDYTCAIDNESGTCTVTDKSFNDGASLGLPQGTIYYNLSCHCENKPPLPAWPTTFHALDCIAFTPSQSTENLGTISKLYNIKNNMCGSIVGAESQSIGEIIPIVGVPFDLYYSTERSEGRIADYTVKLPAAVAQGADLSNVTKLKVSVTVAGKTTSQLLSPAANQIVTYVWDGKDVSGNTLLGSTIATSTTSLVFSDNVERYFINVSYPVGHLKARLLGFGGWTPSIYHFYDIQSKVLYRGDGSIRNVEAKSLTSGFYLAEEDGRQVFYFDKQGRHLKTVTGITGKTLFTFAYTNNRLSSITDGFGKITAFQRDGSGNLISILAPNGKTTSTFFDGAGYLSQVTNPEGKSYLMTYYGGGLIKTFKKPEGQVSTFTYDSNGLLVKDLHSGGFFLQLLKDINSPDFLDVNTPMNRQTMISHNQTAYQDRVESFQNVILPTGVNKYNFDSGASSGNQIADWQVIHTNEPGIRFGMMTPFHTSITSSTRQTLRTQNAIMNSSDIFSIQSLKIETSLMTPENKIETTVYDGATKQYTSTSSLGRVQTTSIDDFERPTSVKIGNLTPTVLTYTSDKLTKTTQGTRVTTFGYDPTSQLLSSTTNALNQTTQFAYDNSERLTQTTLADGRVVKYGYDSNGNLVSLTPAGKPVHNLVQNVYEELSQYQSPKVGTQNNVTTFNYNLDKQLSKITRPDGKVINYDYDAANGLLLSQSSGSNVFSFGYDQYGEINRGTSPLGISNMVQKNSGLASVVNFSTLSLSSIFLQYTRDETLKINQLTFQDATRATKTFAVTYDHDEFLKSKGAAVITYSFPNGTISSVKVGTVGDTFTYDSFGALKSQTSKAGPSTLYTYTITPDLLGRVSNLSETIQGTTTSFDYSYDVTGRLKTVKVNGVQKSNYNYDTNNNILNGTRRGSGFTSTFDTQDRILTTTGKAISTNLAGEVTKITTTADGKNTSFSYDAFGQLTKVTLPSAKIIEYGMDGFHRRGYRKSGSTITDYYLYDENSRVVATLTSGGAFKSVFLYAAKSHVPEYFVTGSTKYKIVTDYLGSVRLVVRVSDNVVMQRMDYDEWGKVINDTKPGFQPFGFAGGLYDSETKLVRFGAREYDPSLGRWLSKDPIRFDGGSTNLFEYVGSDPVNGIDPDGLVHYNSPPPRTVPVSGTTANALTCLEECLKKETNNPALDLLINGGAEQTGHSKNSSHYRNEACDIASPKYNFVSTSNINSCASGCGFSAGQWEPRMGPNSAHWHLQINPGNGVPPLPIKTGP